MLKRYLSLFATFSLLAQSLAIPVFPVYVREVEDPQRPLMSSSSLLCCGLTSMKCCGNNQKKSKVNLQWPKIVLL